jgi:hypothetical protein
MQHINGATQEERFLSVDGILGGLKKRIELWDKKFGKKQSTPFQVGGHAAKCQSGLVLFSFKSLLSLKLANLVVEVEDLPEKEIGFVVLTVVPDEGAERVQKYRLKGKINCINQDWKIDEGDKISVILLYDNPGAAWATLRGEQF